MKTEEICLSFSFSLSIGAHASAVGYFFMAFLLALVEGLKIM
jgi:hypothetical protein